MYAIEFTYVFLAKNLILLLQSIRGTSSSNGILVTNDEYFFFVTDENRDFNSHSEDDVKRQRSHYNGDQIYSNVSHVQQHVEVLLGISFPLKCHDEWP